MRVEGYETTSLQLVKKNHKLLLLDENGKLVKGVTSKTVIDTPNDVSRLTVEILIDDLEVRQEGRG